MAYGFTGSDAEQEHAAVMAENGIHASQEHLKGKVLSHCSDCGEPIAQARIDNAIKMGMKCEYCITCQADHDKAPLPRMLDHVL